MGSAADVHQVAWTGEVLFQSFWHVLALIIAAIHGDEWLTQELESGNNTNNGIDRWNLFYSVVASIALATE